MRISKQPDGTALDDAEKKTLTALLVKLGYTVSVKKEKKGGITVTVIWAE